MSYRDDNPQCATCDAGLARQGERWICEQCGGMLLGARDLEYMLNELSPDDERPIERRLFPASGDPHTCPRCATVMTRMKLYDFNLECCSEHGVWTTRERLELLLAYHTELFQKRTSDATRVLWLAAVPLVGALAGPINTIISPWARRRRLRKHLAETTPKP